MDRKINYRVMPAERHEEYTKLTTVELVEKLARLQAHLNRMCTQVSDPYTTVEQCHDDVRCIMWVKQDIVAVTIALRAKKA